MNDFTRRNRIDLLTPAEKAIYDAMQKVEELPADERLTYAVCLLQDAQNKVADFVDDSNSENNAKEQQFLLSYRIGRRLNEGYGNYALVRANSVEEAKEKLKNKTRRENNDAMSSWIEEADSIRCHNFD
tara:strand:+ start:480 stop:866 length:387 start_codon:yes stop_codon:yes gene_type:complete